MGLIPAGLSALDITDRLYDWCRLSRQQYVTKGKVSSRDIRAFGALALCCERGYCKCGVDEDLKQFISLSAQTSTYKNCLAALHYCISIVYLTSFCPETSHSLDIRLPIQSLAYTLFSFNVTFGGSPWLD
jgi:hypothetical protein